MEASTKGALDVAPRVIQAAFVNAWPTTESAANAPSLASDRQFINRVKKR